MNYFVTQHFPEAYDCTRSVIGMLFSLRLQYCRQELFCSDNKLLLLAALAASCQLSILTVLLGRAYQLFTSEWLQNVWMTSVNDRHFFYFILKSWPWPNDPGKAEIIVLTVCIWVTTFWDLGSLSPQSWSGIAQISPIAKSHFVSRETIFVSETNKRQNFNSIILQYIRTRLGNWNWTSSDWLTPSRSIIQYRPVCMLWEDYLG